MHKGLSFLLLITLAASHVTHAAPNGARLYELNCSACHGLNGEGGVGVPLALPAFLNSVDDHFLFTTIREGRAGRVMPAHPSLSDAQVKAIISHLREWVPDEQRKTIESYTKVKGDPVRGKVLYGGYCSRCHGENGGGGHGTGVTFSRPRELAIMPPALNNPGFLKAASDQMIKRTLMEGRKGTPMRSYLTLGLNEQNIDDIVSYVRSFEQTPIHWRFAEIEEPVLMLESDYSLEETVENVKRAAIGKNFRIIRVQNLEEGLFPEQQQNKKQVMIYFCNFNFINKALSLDPRIGLFMPCRISVVEENGKVHMMAINPRYLSRVYNNAELDQSCTEMFNVYTDIMEEASL
ncbi:MAG TPA: c-type cytochrome [Ectothiorhodospiraceae bacterium]|nr:c-type cytochrome [Ectothiorhodospiraceae bacterium]